MILLSHPTGNTFVRTLLKTLAETGWDYSFFTSLVFDPKSQWHQILPEVISKELARRSFEVPSARLHTNAARELGRLFFSKIPGRPFTKHESGFFSVDAVYRSLDRAVANELRKDAGQKIRAVYAYEDGAFHTFSQARSQGIKCYYELPIAYWETSQKLLSEEADRWPEWEPTLVGTRESIEKLQRKTAELAGADVVICPSQFVRNSLPNKIQQEKKCVVAEFGSPAFPVLPPQNRENKTRALRVLFAGSMTQRKGLADLFAAMHLLKNKNVELVVMGSPIMPMEFYRKQFPDFKYEAPRPHHEVLQLMQTCDVLALPSIVEGRALVQQEALSCGLPLIVTPNAGGEDLIEPGKSGFLVPIRAPEKIAEKIDWFENNRSGLPDMRMCAQETARRYTWKSYGEKILSTFPDSLKT